MIIYFHDQQVFKRNTIRKNSFPQGMGVLEAYLAAYQTSMVGIFCENS